MGLFRCEDIIRCQLYLPNDVAYHAVANLGEINAIEFIDLNDDVNSFRRQYKKEIQRIDELQRKLRYFVNELHNYDKEVPDVDDFSLTPSPKELVEIEEILDDHEKDLKEMCNNLETLQQHKNQMLELQEVLEKCQPYFPEESAVETSDDQKLKTHRKHVHLWCSTGVIPVNGIPGFMRMVFLSSRGSTVVHVLDGSKPKTKNTGEKAVFLAVSQGKELKIQLEIIAKSYKATMYPLPIEAEERADMLEEVKKRQKDLETVIVKSKEQIDGRLQQILGLIPSWEVKLVKMKAVYHVLDMFQQESHGLIAEGYVLIYRLDDIRKEVDSAYKSAALRGMPLINPIKSTHLPTFHRTNKFTNAFQTIIDAYGIASYKEINPAFFSIISFPFLFSVMFGDAGHGVIMLFFAIILCVWEKKLERPTSKNEILRIIFAGRYMILLMALFSIYAGVLYNDIFSKPFNIFGCKYRIVYDKETLALNHFLQVDPSDVKVYTGPPYPLGIDPIWELSENKITYLNSFKKKISVIFGFSQMALGVFLSLFNHVYFKNYVNIVCEFLPMVVFLFAIFGYMCALIFVKWFLVVRTSDPVTSANNYQCSPNILIGFINMFMFKYDNSRESHCSNHTWYNHQKEVQTAMVLLALVCVFWLLLSKPLYLLCHKKSNRITPAHEQSSVSESNTDHVIEINEESVALLDEKTKEEKIEQQNSYLRQFAIPVPAEEPFDFGELFIHQAIHMIEYCLGCISHTASYLRLWALSLAHAQLSDVLWKMVLRHGFAMDFGMGAQVLITFVLLCPFAMLTIIILLIMEGLSAFLHTLRLHWVEFNSKFYVGDGQPFRPFSFRELIKAMKQD